MTVAQWVFHYIEIMKNKKEDTELLSNLIKHGLSTISEDIDLLGVLINPEGSKSLMEIKRKYRDGNNTETNNVVDNTHQSISNNDVLNDTDKELLEFFNDVPETMTPTEQQLNVGKYCLPTVDVKKKMKLGFEVLDNAIEKINELDKNISRLEEQYYQNNIVIDDKLEIIDSLDDSQKPQLGFQEGSEF